MKKKKIKPDENVNATNNDELTKREKEIVIMHMQGKNRKDIARIWNKAVSTVDAHIKHVHLKTGTSDVCGVIRYGYDNKFDKEETFSTHF